MPKKQSYSLIRSIAIAGFVFAAGTAQAQQISGADFIATHAGNCVSYTGPSAGVQCYAADGTTNYNDTTYGTDTGQWEVRGDDVCETWVKEPGWDCGPVTQTADNTFTDGTYTWTLN